MKKILCLIMSVIVALSLFGCSEKANDNTISRDYMAMDTVFSLRIGEITSEGGKSASDIFDECERLTAEIEGILSAVIEDSELTSLNANVNAIFDVDPTLIEVLTVARDIYELTDGAYDPAIGSLVSLWNVKNGGPVPADDKVTSAMKASGMDKIEVGTDYVKKSDTAVKIDLGGIGKGYVAQKLAEYLFESGAPYGIVSAGRTVGVFGTKPDGESFKIGIADPFNPDGVAGYIYTDSGFVSVSGDYEQYFEEDGLRYHHIIDPDTGYPADSGLSSVAVLSQNGAAADALSTALLVMGYDKAIELYKSGKISFEAVFIEDDGDVKTTSGLTEDRFELETEYENAAITLPDVIAKGTKPVTKAPTPSVTSASLTEEITGTDTN